MGYRYYSTLRPLTPGTFPKPQGNRVLTVMNFDNRTYCSEIKREAWGYVEYERPLSTALAWDWELARMEV